MSHINLKLFMGSVAVSGVRMVLPGILYSYLHNPAHLSQHDMRKQTKLLPTAVLVNAVLT